MRAIAVCVIGFLIGNPNDQKGRCGQSMTYENRNQIHYGPLLLQQVVGTARDAQGVSVPGVCLGVFAEGPYTLVAMGETDEQGQFRLEGIPNGDYRVVAKSSGFCSANVRVRIERRGKKRLRLQMKPADLDGCSYGEY